MCGFSKPKVPAAPEVAPIPLAPPVVAPIEADTASKTAGDEERRRRKAASGRSDTILTSGLGAAGQAMVGGNKLLGE